MWPRKIWSWSKIGNLVVLTNVEEFFGVVNAAIWLERSKRIYNQRLDNPSGVA